MEKSGIFKSSLGLHTRFVNASKIKIKVPKITNRATSKGTENLFFLFGLFFCFCLAI